MSTEDLLEFIEARLTEDQAAAEAIDVPDWRSESSWMSELIDPLPSQRRAYDGQFPLITAEDVEHIARHDPARVLRDVPAKRRLLALHDIRREVSDFEGRVSTVIWCATCNEPDWCLTLKLLALPFADHPGYDPSWSPADD